MKLLNVKKTAYYCTFLSALMLCGCQTNSRYDGVDQDTLADIQAALLKASIPEENNYSDTVESSEEIFTAFVPELDISEASLPIIEERFNFLLNGDMQVRDFFAMLTEDTPYSIVVHPDVQGTISAMDLKNVTLEETLNQVTSLYDFVLNKNGNIFQVLPGGLQTRIFKIDYLNVARNGSSNMQIVASGISQGNNNTGNANSNQNNSGFSNFANNNAPSAANTSQSTSSGGASISTTSEANYWENLKEIVLSIINAYQNESVNNSNDRSVIISPHTGLIIVRAYPSELDQVEEFLDQSQSILQRQVVLEAKILEVELKEGFQAGIDLQALSRVNSDNQVSFNLNFIGDQLNGVSSPSAIGYQATDFDGVINLLETQGNVQVISSPRISTLNNQKAVFKVGNEQYYLTNANSTSFGSGDTATTNQNTSLQPFFSGIALDVTPQISDLGDIILHIHPILSQVQEDIRVIGGEEFPLANSTTRESDSVARARNGEVIVISGLMQARSRGQEGGLPGVKELPLVGKAFEQRQSTSTKTELVILLRAIVDNDNKQMQAVINEHTTGFEELRNILLQ